MIRTIPAVLASAVLLTTTPSLAQTTAVTDDEVTQCIVALSIVSDKATGADKANFTGVMLYFAGKLATRHSPSEIKTMIDQQASAKIDAVAMSRDCASEVQALGTALQGK